MSIGTRAQSLAHGILGGGMPDKPVAVRLPEDLIARIDRHLERMRRANPGLNPNRADAIRVLLTTAVEAAEKAAKSRGK